MVDAWINIIEKKIDPFDKGESKTKEVKTFDDKGMRDAIEGFLKIDEEEEPSSVFAFSIFNCIIGISDTFPYVPTRDEAFLIRVDYLLKNWF